MRNIKLAMAMAVAISASNAANATNEISNVSVGVTAYIAAGLNITSNPMDFGAVVAPTNATGPSSVQIECNGNVSYSVNGSPAGPGAASTAGEANASIASPTLPSTGDITISGEPDYAITVSVIPGVVPGGVTLSPGLLPSGTCVAPATAGEYQLDDTSGDLTLTLFGQLLVSSAYVPPTNQADKAINTNVLVTVSYR